MRKEIESPACVSRDDGNKVQIVAFDQTRPTNANEMRPLDVRGGGEVDRGCDVGPMRG